MKNIKFYIILCIIAFVSGDDSKSDENSDLSDFEFDSNNSDDYYDSDDAKTFQEKKDSYDGSDSFTGESAIDDDSNAFTEKEHRIRDALLKATKDSVQRKKFTQILPILRALSRQQRLVLASLISAQANPTAGRALNLAQVEELFGDRKKLLLPIIFDIANLVKSTSYEKYNNLQENEMVPEAQFLRRSDTVDLEKITTNDSQPVLITDISIPDNNLKDDTLQVDENDSATTNLVNIEADNNNEHRKVKSIVPKNPVSDIKSQARPSKEKSYHERKFNMTNFNGTNDQYAMESYTPIKITLPLSHKHIYNISMEDYEDLALADLNDTEILNKITNGSEENLPLPEMLISRYRLKPPYRKFSSVLPLGGLRTCERFGTLCIRVEDYPMQQIMGSIRRHKHAMSALLAEYTDKDDMEYTNYLQEVATNRREDEESTPGSMCPSVIRYARPQKARSASGEWKYIVNTGQHTQTLRLEKCGKPEEACTFLTDNFRSRCVQIFNYHRLLSWDNIRGLHVDIFKVPTCCSCHIDGYKETFPPINSYSSAVGLGGFDPNEDYRFSASNLHSHNTRYTTIVKGDNDDDDDDDSIAYQYSNGFKRLPIRFTKHTDSSLLIPSASNTKPRYDKTKNIKQQQDYLSDPALDAYLTPPTSFEFDNGGNTFKRGVSSGKRHRRPVRTHSRDQNLAGSDFLPDITMIPTHDIFTERSMKRKSTTPLMVTSVSTKRMSTVKLPSISAAPTSNIDLGKRVNYNYHPIIDFFGDSVKSEKEINDRVGYSNERINWRPLQANRRHAKIDQNH